MPTAVESAAWQNAIVQARLDYIVRLLEYWATIVVPNIPPQVDPAATDTVRAGAMQAESYYRPRPGPGPIIDPAATDLRNVRMLDLVRRIRGGFVDPAVTDLANLRLGDLLGRIGPIPDPPPEDIARLSTVELEAQIHGINAEIVRLKSIEQMLSKRLHEAGKAAAGASESERKR